MFRGRQIRKPLLGNQKEKTDEISNRFKKFIKTD